MGTISANKVGALALMFAPFITLIFYFLQPGGAFIDTADPADAGATINAMVSNAALGKIASVLIPIGLLFFAYGLFVLQENVRSNGNGDALTRLGALFLFVGIIGWMVGSGVSLAISGSGLTATQAAAVYGSLYGATVGISTVAGILAGIGFLALALALSTREDQNKIAAIVAAVAAVVVIVVTIIGGLDSSQLQVMSNITGACYVIHMVWLFLVGQVLLKQESD